MNGTTPLLLRAPLKVLQQGTSQGGTGSFSENIAKKTIKNKICKGSEGLEHVIGIVPHLVGEVAGERGTDNDKRGDSVSVPTINLVLLRSFGGS